MRKIEYGKDVPGHMYIGQANDKILIVSMGPRSPFDFVDVLNKAISSHLRKIGSDTVEIYFDLLSCLGDRSNRFAKVIYSKDKGIDILSFENIKREDLPPEIKRELENFLREKIKLIMENSILSSREKQKLQANPV